MADDLRQIVDMKNTIIDALGAPGSIKAADHNELEEFIIQSLGRYSGYPYIARREFAGGVMQFGNFYWGANSMNKTDPFNIVFSAQTVDGYPLNDILNIIQVGAILKAKDFRGRAGVFVIQAKQNLLDSNGTVYLGLTVVGNALNPNYTYQVNETEPIIIEFLNSGGGGADPVLSRHIRTDIAADANNITLPDLVDAVSIDGVISQSSGIKMQDITFDASAGKIAGFNVETGESYLIFYTK